MPGVSFIVFTTRFFRAIWEGLKDPQFRALFISIIILLLGGMVFYHYVEGWSWLDSLYFSVITLATVGYGDFSPQTAVGKIFTMIYIILGLGELSAFVLLLAKKQTTPPLVSKILPHEEGE